MNATRVLWLDMTDLGRAQSMARVNLSSDSCVDGLASENIMNEATLYTVDRADVYSSL